MPFITPGSTQFSSCQPEMATPLDTQTLSAFYDTILPKSATTVPRVGFFDGTPVSWFVQKRDDPDQWVSAAMLLSGVFMVRGSR